MTTAPQTQICIVGPTVAPDQTVCERAVANFVAGGRGLTQSVNGRTKRSRILDVSPTSDSTTWATALQTAINVCANELRNIDAVRSHFQTGLCDNDGRYFDVSSAFVPNRVTTDVPNMTPNACRAQ